MPSLLFRNGLAPLQRVEGTPRTSGFGDQTQDPVWSEGPAPSGSAAAPAVVFRRPNRRACLAARALATALAVLTLTGLLMWISADNAANITSRGPILIPFGLLFVVLGVVTYVLTYSRAVALNSTTLRVPFREGSWKFVTPLNIQSAFAGSVERSRSARVSYEVLRIHTESGEILEFRAAFLRWYKNESGEDLERWLLRLLQLPGKDRLGAINSPAGAEQGGLTETHPSDRSPEHPAAPNR